MEHTLFWSNLFLWVCFAILNIVRVEIQLGPLPDVVISRQKAFTTYVFPTFMYSCYLKK